jgi:hypothetical protein
MMEDTDQKSYILIYNNHLIKYDLSLLIEE